MDTGQKRENLESVHYCCKYALTQLPQCIFSTQSYRFGYEYNQTMIYFQADAIAKCIPFTQQVLDRRDNGTYHALMQNITGALNQYLCAHLQFQGDPQITPYLIQTDQAKGITPVNVDNAITLLTYDTVRQSRYDVMGRQMASGVNPMTTMITTTRNDDNDGRRRGYYYKGHKAA